MCHIYCHLSWQKLRKVSSEEEELKLLLWSTELQKVHSSLFHSSTLAYCNAVSIVVKKVSLAGSSTSSWSMSGRDQSEELRWTQEELPNVSLDEEVVLAAQRVKISRHQSSCLSGQWSNQVLYKIWVCKEGWTKRKTYNFHSGDDGWKSNIGVRKYLRFWHDWYW